MRSLGWCSYVVHKKNCSTKHACDFPRWIWQSWLTLCCLFSAAISAANSPVLEQVHFLIPGGAGGGWDRTARGVGLALKQSGLVNQVSFENMSGGGGAKGIAHTIEVADPNQLLVNSSPIVIRSIQKIFPQSFRDLAPIASVIGDYGVIAVRHDADSQTLADLLERQHIHPRKVAFAGGSVPGSTDHIVAAMVVKGFGNNPSSTKYIPYDAGGKAMAGLLSGEVQALSSGYGEVKDLADQGWVKILCIAAPERLTVAPATPTCHEAGAINAVFINWRGFFAAPNITTEKVAEYEAVFAQLIQQPQWEKIRSTSGWVNNYLPSAAFTQMLIEQEHTVAELMTELGLL